MKTMPTYRQGRKYYRPGARGNGGICSVLSAIVVLLILLATPFIFISTEVLRYNTYTALSDTLDKKIVELSQGVVNRGDLVHGTSSIIESTTSDLDMGITISGALTLSRKTEYCQWQELQREVCQTCTQTVRASDGSTKEESFQCDCVTSYSYVKTWRSHRINSLMFDQPAAHHNPMRDPLPSSKFVSQDATMNFSNNKKDSSSTTKTTSPSALMETAYVTPVMLEKNIRGAISRPVNWVRGGIPPIPSFWTRWMPDRTRYENTLELSHSQPNSYAAQYHDFVYVGDGYFFSPHQAISYENLFQYFMQYVEGSIFDWQIGDIMPSCTAGDVRVWYQVQDPATVSFIGQVGDIQDMLLAAKTVTIEPHVMQSGVLIGFVHAGVHSTEEMVIAEDSDSLWQAFMFRMSLLLLSVPLSRLLGAVLGKNISNAKLASQIACVGVVWCGIIGASWMFIWGYSVDTIFMILSCLALSSVVVQFPPPQSNSVQGLRAGWCILARWMNVPPEWRAEDSYYKGK